MNQIYSATPSAAGPRKPRFTTRCAAWVAAAFLVGQAAAAVAATERTFDFTYAFTVTGLTPGQTAKIWFPIPPGDDAQQVQVVAKALPADARSTQDAVSRNQMYYVEAAAGSDGMVPLAVTYRVTRHAIDAQPVRHNEDIAADLKPDRLIPLGGRPTTLFVDKPLPADDTAKARTLFDIVYNGLTYSKDKPGWGRGDVNWVCDSRSGNCSDFHSLFISLARTAGLPAKFEVGFIIPSAPKPPTVANYHCWAFFKPSDKDWVPVDISAAKNRPMEKDFYFGHLDPNRIAFSQGRDLTLSPPQAGPPLNFFVYPYVEIDGRPYPDNNIKRAFHADPVPAS